MARIAFAGSKTTTRECIEQFLRDGFHVDLLVTLTPESAAHHQVAGYMDLRPFAAEHGIEVYHPHEYSLKSDADEGALRDRGLDCVLVVGWQRLIPEWWLGALRLGAFGMHGSHEPLPRGRGRSPMNWALAWGKRSFTTHLFRYDAGVDSGAIVGAQRFDINVWDDCETLHFKNRIAMNRLLKEHLPAILAGEAVYTPQPTDIEPTYLPKRTPDHGRIVWTEMDMRALHDHIRCQTRPFPGAFSYLQGRPERFYFWRGEPFDTHLLYPGARPGTVVERFYDGSFLVAVWDGTVRIHDYTAPDGEPPPLAARFVDDPAGA
jgi:methionyl-tRNA formyltransferase